MRLYFSVSFKFITFCGWREIHFKLIHRVEGSKWGSLLLIFYTYAAISLDVLFSFLEGLGQQRHISSRTRFQVNHFEKTTPSYLPPELLQSILRVNTLCHEEGSMCRNVPSEA